MLLEPLVSTIETLQSRIQTHAPTLRENETRTRMSLIDPLLTALGWDISDPTLVLPEYTAAGGRADYALLGQDGRPATLIEAKRIGEPLEPHRMQMLNYSNAEGIEYAGLTDGNRWELYQVFERGTLDERRILDINIAEVAPHRCALQFLILWRPNLASGKPVRASVPALASTPDGVIPERVPDTGRLIEPIPQPSRNDEPGWTPISEVNPKPGDLPPTKIRFNRGPISAVTGWNKALLETAEWLSKKGDLTIQKCPIEIGNTRNLVSISPNHRNGVDFKNPYQTSTGLYVELHFSARNCHRYIRFLLEKFSVPVDTVELCFD